MLTKLYERNRRVGVTPSNAIESYNAASILNVVVESQEDAVSDTDPQFFEGGSSIKVIASLPTLKMLVLFPVLLALILIVVWVTSCSGFDFFSLPPSSCWLLHRLWNTLHLSGQFIFGSENLSGSHLTNQEVASFSRFFFDVIKISSRPKAVTSKLRQVCFKIVLHFVREM